LAKRIPIGGEEGFLLNVLSVKNILLLIKHGLRQRLNIFVVTNALQNGAGEVAQWRRNNHFIKKAGWLQKEEAMTG
jgi:hypothetical protein